MSTTEFRQPTHREELGRVLASGASAQIAHTPENAAAIAKGIKTVLDELAPVAPHPVAVSPLPVLDHGTAYIESDIQANSHHIGCKGERCMASAANGYAHSRECIAEAGRCQGWVPTDADFASAGPSAPLAECCVVAPTDSHASAVLYPAIERAMAELGSLHPAFNFAVNRAFNHLHDAFWSECPAPASAAPKRPDFPGV